MVTGTESKTKSPAQAKLKVPDTFVPYTPAQKRAGFLSLRGLAALWEQRSLISLFVQRDFAGRYRGSLLGAVWPLLNPLGHMVLYTFLFSVVLQVKFGASTSTSSFALYLMSGFLPWSAMSEAMSSATTKILEVPNLVKKVVFPLEILPLVTTVSAFLSGVIGIAIVILFAAVIQQTIHPTLLLLPVVIIPHFLFTLGVSWLVASLGVFVRDCRHFMALGLSAWMYMTPIVYPAERLPENLKFILYINPVAGMITDYRKLILEGSLPDFYPYLAYTSLSVVICLLGFHFFYRTKNSFADIM